jgi:aspartyl protease family protein
MSLDCSAASQRTEGHSDVLKSTGKNMKFAALITALLLVAVPARAAETVEIDVLGLFKDSAIVSVNGEQVLLKLGVTTKEGISLVSADSRGAVIKINDELMNLDLSSKISARYAPSMGTTVAIAQANNQYRTTGSINGRPVMFVVDTGATVVAMNEEHARDLGLDLRLARPFNATTASGQVKSLQLMVAEMTVGDIKVNNVSVAVLPGEFPVDILLGMSFLRKVEISQNAGLMLLKSR